MMIFELFQSSAAAFFGLVAVVSLLVGSFLNVVIHRLPIMMERAWRAGLEEFSADTDASLQVADACDAMEDGQGDIGASDEGGASGSSVDEEPFNLAVPRSRCPHCGAGISAWQNIPVISYLLLRGKCGNCGAAISVRYPIIEALTLLLSLIVAWQLGPTPAALLGILVTWFFVAMTMIDIDHQLLPDSLTLPLMWIGLLTAALSPVFTDLHASVIGAATGYGVLWLVFQLFRLVTGKEGMGYGDFKLLAAIGALLGWQVLPMVILLSSLVGAVVGIAIIAVTGRDRNIPIPFGPYLAAAGWIAMLWGESLTSWYFGMFG